MLPVARCPPHPVCCTFAPELLSFLLQHLRWPLPHLHWDWAQCCHIRSPPVPSTCNICTRMTWPVPRLNQGCNLSCNLNSAWARQVPATAAGSGLVDQLEALARLFRDGLLTEPEFVAAKRRLLF